MKYVHFNNFVDGCHKIGVFDTFDEAKENVRKFIGHLDIPQPGDAWVSDDGDFCFIEAVEDEDVKDIPDTSYPGYY
jgi:hypothetical protein